MLRRLALGAIAALSLAFTAAHAACPNPRIEEFGYNTMPTTGTRPLLIVYVDFDDAPINPQRIGPHYRNIVFAPNGSVNAMFHTASGGRFNFTNAGFVNVAWSGPGTGLPEDFGPRATQLIAAAMRTQRRTFESFDTNGDRVISDRELVILRVSNSPVFRLGAQASYHEADLGNGYRFAGQTANVDEEVDQNGIAHEIFHVLGFNDHIYGPAGLNANASFFSVLFDVDDGPGPVGLDPYHRMRAGWIRPQLIEMGTSGVRGIRHYGDSPPDHTLLFYSNERCAREFFLAEFRNASRPLAAVDRGFYGTGVLMWYVQPTADFSPFQFNWPPPIRGPYVPTTGNHMIADYVVSRNGPGARGVIAAGTDEFGPVWGDGSPTNVLVETAYRPSDEEAFVGWRRAGGRYVARIDAINGVARPEPISLAGSYRLIITGQFPVNGRGVRAELVSLRGRTPIAISSYRPNGIELRPPATTTPGPYQIHLVGPAGREIVTRGNQLVTFR